MQTYKNRYSKALWFIFLSKYTHILAVPSIQNIFNSILPVQNTGKYSLPNFSNKYDQPHCLLVHRKVKNH